jgi:hypothetical protein
MQSCPTLTDEDIPEFIDAIASVKDICDKKLNTPKGST